MISGHDDIIILPILMTKCLRDIYLENAIAKKMTRQVFCKRIDSNVFTFPDAEGSIVFQFLTFADAEESMDFQFLAFTELIYFNAMPKET